MSWVWNISLFLLVHLALLMFTDLTRSYHGFGIWIVFIILTAIAGLCLLGSDKKTESENDYIARKQNLPQDSIAYQSKNKTVNFEI